MPDIKRLNPDTLGKPLAQYSCLIAGQVAMDRDGMLIGVDDFDAQWVEVFANIKAALGSAGASHASHAIDVHASLAGRNVSSTTESWG